uniref:R-spondin Fu-CRD domain-containing protein n=1 Tax=Strigamia maritima TaxID=126957 RepID=T1JBV6_STRMM
MHRLHLTLYLTMVIAGLALDGREKRTLYGNQCPRGCRICSPANGCVRCKSRFFLLLRRTHMRQIGVCVLSCPLHHYGTGNRGFNYCTKCKIEKCDICFNKNYCTRCVDNYVEHRGQCINQCPEGTSSQNETSQKCLPKVDCGIDEWSPWGVCAKKGRTCGFKYGFQSRVRAIKLPSSSAGRCPPITDNRRCRMIHRFCPEIISNESELGNKRKNRNRKRKNDGKRQWKRKKKLRQRNETLVAKVSNRLNDLLI